MEGVKVGRKFKDIVNESGANVKEWKITDNVSVRTWGNNEDGSVTGVYFYEKDKDQYSEGVSLI